MSDTKKTIIVAMTPRHAEELQKKNGNGLVTVFPATPVSRRILFQFLRGNTIFRRLADAMVWGQIDAMTYSYMNDKLSAALKSVDDIIKDATTHLRAADKARKGAQKKATALVAPVKAEAPKNKPNEKKRGG